MLTRKYSLVRPKNTQVQATAFQELHQKKASQHSGEEILQMLLDISQPKHLTSLSRILIRSGFALITQKLKKLNFSSEIWQVEGLQVQVLYYLFILQILQEQDQLLILEKDQKRDNSMDLLIACLKFIEQMDFRDCIKDFSFQFLELLFTEHSISVHLIHASR